MTVIILGISLIKITHCAFITRVYDTDCLITSIIKSPFLESYKENQCGPHFNIITHFRAISTRDIANM